MGGGERWRRGPEGGREDSEHLRARCSPLLSPADAQLLYACDSRDLITVFRTSWLLRALTQNSLIVPTPPHTQGSITLLSPLTWNTQTQPCPSPPLCVSEKLEEELLLEAKGESLLQPSDAPDLDPASEPERPLAITSRATDWQVAEPEPEPEGRIRAPGLRYLPDDSQREGAWRFQHGPVTTTISSFISIQMFSL